MSTRSDPGLLRVGFVGESRATEERRRAVDRSEDVLSVRLGLEEDGAAATPGGVCFVALPVSEAAEEAKRLARLGCHVFLDTPKLPSVRDLQQVARVAEEAGISVGVSRPLRFSPQTADWDGRSAITVVEAEFGVAPESWQIGLSETLDLCMYLSGSSATRNVEVSIERENRIWPIFAAASIRFDNGSLAILSLRRSRSPAPTRCTATVDSEVRQLRLRPTADAFAAETLGFLQAIARDERPPTSVSDAVAGSRLLDQVLGLLR